LPYIPPLRRKDIDPFLEPLLKFMLENKDRIAKGDVTYMVTRLVVRYVKCKDKNYDSLSNVDGILGTANKEFYRVVTGPYEQKKQLTNDPNREIYGEILG